MLLPVSVAQVLNVDLLDLALLLLQLDHVYVELLLPLLTGKVDEKIAQRS